MKQIVLFISIIGVLFLTGCTKQQDVNVDSDTQATGAQNGNSEDKLNTIEKSNETAEDIVSSMKIINFETDKFEVRNDMLAKVKKSASKVLSYTQPINIKIEGNCDEWGSDEYNYALGLKRAKAVQDILVSEGIDKKTLSTVSYGESNPTCKAKNKTCWAKNRRVEYKIK